MSDIETLDDIAKQLESLAKPLRDYVNKPTPDSILQEILEILRPYQVSDADQYVILDRMRGLYKCGQRDLAQKFIEICEEG